MQKFYILEIPCGYELRKMTRKNGCDFYTERGGNGEFGFMTVIYNTIEELETYLAQEWYNVESDDGCYACSRARTTYGDEPTNSDMRAYHAGKICLWEESCIIDPAEAIEADPSELNEPSPSNLELYRLMHYAECVRDLRNRVETVQIKITGEWGYIAVLNMPKLVEIRCGLYICTYARSVSNGWILSEGEENPLFRCLPYIVKQDLIFGLAHPGEPNSASFKVIA